MDIYVYTYIHPAQALGEIDPTTKDEYMQA